MKSEEAINRIVELVLILSEKLAYLKDKGVNPNDLWPLHPDREVTDLFKDAKPLVIKIFDIVKKQNGEVLSDEVILERLLYNVAALRMKNNLLDEDIKEKARKTAGDLITYDAYRNVDVPLISLEIDGDPFIFGPISYFPILLPDKKTDWWERAKATLGTSIDNLFLSYARVNVPGDSHTSTKNANELVNEGLLILRGICFSLEFKDIHQFGIINEFPIWESVPYRLDKTTETTRVDANSRFVTSTGPFRFPYKLYKDFLSKIDREKLTRFLKLIEVGFITNNEINNRILLGFRWLGEATRPDTLSARFAKIAFSLESFIGGEANSKDLTTRGITATLAERAAFSLGNDLDSRKKTDREIRKYYAMRSGIAHGKSQIINPNDFIKFGKLVRRIGWALVDRSAQFNKVNDLQKWVNDRKYS